MANARALVTVAALTLNSCTFQPQSQGDWAMHWEQGRQAMDRREYEVAVREISRSIELTPSRQSKNMFLDRGDAYFGQGDFEQAIADYTHAVQLSKRNAGEIMGGDYASRTRTFDLAPIYEKIAAAYSALALKSRGR